MKKRVPVREPQTAVKQRINGAAHDISVIIPVFDSAQWLDACLSSVLVQSEVDLEVICIDDGSTDGSAAVLQRFVETDPRVMVIRQDRGGQSRARNAGIKSATGRYIFFLDSDDYLCDDVLGALVRRSDADSLDILLFDGVAFSDGVTGDTWTRYATYYQRKGRYRGVRRGAHLMSLMRRAGDYRPHVGLYLTRAGFMRDVQSEFLPGIVHQDNPFTFRLLLNAGRAGYERREAYARRIRPGSTITTLTPDVSVRGYFLSYVAMRGDLDKYLLTSRAPAGVQSVVNGAMDAARKQFSQLTTPQREEFAALPGSTEAAPAYALLASGKVTHRSRLLRRIPSRMTGRWSRS